MFKLPYNCAHFTCQQGCAQNPSSQASVVQELRTFRCTSWLSKRQRNQRPNCQHSLGHGESKGVLEKHIHMLHWLHKSSGLCGSQQIVENSWGDGNTKPLYLPPEKPVGRSRSNSLNWTWNNRLIQNWKRSTLRLYIVTLFSPDAYSQDSFWWGWKKSEKADLNFNIQKAKIMVSSPIISWQIKVEKVEAVRDFILLFSKITVDTDCSHEIERHLLLGRKAMTNLDSIWKSKDIILLTKVPIIKAMVFPVVMYRCERWTMKKVEHWRIDVFKLWC